MDNLMNSKGVPKNLPGFDVNETGIIKIAPDIMKNQKVWTINRDNVSVRARIESVLVSMNDGKIFFSVTVDRSETEAKHKIVSGSGDHFTTLEIFTSIGACQERLTG